MQNLSAILYLVAAVLFIRHSRAVVAASAAAATSSASSACSSPCDHLPDNGQTGVGADCLAIAAGG